MEPAENAAGSLTLGAGNDAGLFFDGTNLVAITNGAGASGIVLDSEDDTVEILGSGTLQATFDTGGLNLVSGDTYEINGTSVLSNNTLGSGVTASSLTSVGTLAGLTLGGNLTQTSGTTTLLHTTIDGTSTTTGNALFQGTITGQGNIIQTNGTSTLLDTTIAGSATTSGLTVNGTTLFQPLSDNTSFLNVLDADGGTPIININSTVESVGIGSNASPASDQKLTVGFNESTAYDPATANTFVKQFVLQNTSGGTGVNNLISLQTAGSNSEGLFGVVQNASGYSDFVFLSDIGDSYSELARLTSSGQLGIGTSSPAALLHLATTTEQLRLSYDTNNSVFFTVESDADLLVTPTSTGAILFQPTTDQTDFFQILDANGGTPIFNIDSTNERVGIGTSTPSGVLEVASTTGETILLVNPDGNVAIGTSTVDDVTNLLTLAKASGDTFLQFHSANTATQGIAFGDPQSSATGRIYYAHNGDYMAFYTNGGNERLRIDSSGNVGIGDAGPDAHLEVSASGSTGGNVFLLSSDDGNDGDLLTVSESGNIIQGSGTTTLLHTTIAGSATATDLTITGGLTLSTDLSVANGGTGASTFTDGGILLGSGTGAITAMSVLADGSIVVGDGSTDPVALAAFTSSTGLLKHESGGVELDISSIGVGDILAGASAGTLEIVDGGSASDGDVLTIQADGTANWEAAAGGGGGAFVHLTDENVLAPATTTSDFIIGAAATASAPLWFDASTGELTLSKSTSGGYLLDINNSNAGGYAGRFQVNSADILTIGDPIITAATPLAVTAAGDTGVAYDLVFTNIESSHIKSEGPLYITAGDPNHNEDLVLGASGSGIVQVRPGDSLTVENGYLCVDDGDSGPCSGQASFAAGTIYSNAAAVESEDLAENYPTLDASSTPGDLLAFDPTMPGHVTKTSQAYDPRLMGVISTQPGFLLGGISEENEVMVALAGKVPATVSNDGGPIAIGDPITSSDQLGIGARANSAGRIVGYALESFAPSATTTEVGQVLLFVSPGYYAGDLALGDDGNLTQNGTSTLATSTEAVDEITRESWIASLFDVVRDTWSLTVGRLTSREITLSEGDSETGSIVGSSAVPAHFTSVTIENNAVRENSKIILTMKAATDGYWIEDQKDGQFTVRLRLVQNHDVEFDYIIFQVEGKAEDPELDSGSSEESQGDEGSLDSISDDETSPEPDEPQDPATEDVIPDPDEFTPIGEGESTEEDLQNDQPAEESQDTEQVNNEEQVDDQKENNSEGALDEPVDEVYTDEGSEEEPSESEEVEEVIEAPETIEGELFVEPELAPVEVAGEGEQASETDEASEANEIN